MVFPSHGNHLSRDFVLDNIFHMGRDFGIIASKKRLRRSLRETSREVEMRTWFLLVRQRREKERVLKKRVTMMEDHHSQGRIRT
jgi:hypothetical protein